MNDSSRSPTRTRSPRLQPVLVAPFVLQIFVAVSLVGYLSFRNGQSAVNTVASQLRAELTTRIREKLQGYTQTPYAINRLNAAAVTKGEIDASHFKGEGTFLQEIQIYPSMSAVYYGDAQGAYYCVDRLPDQTLPGLEISGISTGFKQSVFALDAEGHRGQLIKKIQKTYDPRRRPWYIAAKKSRQAVWSDIYLDFTTLLPCVTASVPVYNRSTGALMGVCATDLFLPSQVSSFLRNLKIGKTGTAFIIERSGQLVATSGQEPMTVGKGENTQRLYAVASGNPTIQATAGYLKDRFAGFAGIGQEEQLDFSLNGHRQFVQVVPFKDRNLDWLIVLTIPESDFMGEIDRQTHITLLICVAALLAAIGMGILTAGRITRPIEQITRASEEMAAGHLDQHVKPSQIVELDKLGSSFNGMAGQLKESFETLEEKVNERTAELATANESIAALNDRLKTENLRMGAELDMLREMQQLILPKQEELDAITDLAIAGYMEPAAEVGGDYYDVLQTDGVVTIGIGDVTGHGLESGILMVMTQTAVRTLKEIQERDHVRFLDTLNRTIYKNVARMNSDKTLTLAILNYFDGTISISGQHEETIVVREGGHIERVNTMDLGFPIGLDLDIADMVNHTTVELKTGDGVVLYTDGIPEAQDTKGAFYGVERLCTIIGQNWHQDVEEIKQAVIDDVHGFIGEEKMYDDITLVVMKYRGG